MLDDSELITPKCSRTIRPNKYEKQSPETFNWWCRLFRMMEIDFAVPTYKRQKIIREIFPEKILEKIISIVTMVEPLEEPTRSRSAKLLSSRSENFSSRITLRAGVYVPSTIRSNKSISLRSTTSRDADESEEGRHEIHQKFCHRLTHVESEAKEVGSNNPYLKFFRRNPQRVAIWRDLPPLSINEMNLSQKSEAITTAIATDFVNWIQNLGGIQPSTLDVEQVVKMFEVGFHMHAATSLQGLIKEMPAVPKQVAERNSESSKTVRSKLQEKIQQDVLAFRTPKRTRAFETTLPQEMRFVPPKENAAEKWFRSKAHESLQTMSAVWEGITHLRSTRAFCLWLTNHPNLPEPRFLQERGMLSPDFIEEFQKSRDQSQDPLDAKITAPGLNERPSAVMQSYHF